MSNQAAHLQAIAGYGAAWQEKDPTKRRATLDAVFAANGIFEDPVASVAGREAFDVHIEEFQRNFPDATFEIVSPIDMHHGRHRFVWRMTASAGQVRLEATNVGRVDAEGRLVEMVDFFHGG